MRLGQLRQVLKLSAHLGQADQDLSYDSDNAWSVVQVYFHFAIPLSAAKIS
jgi:hypothetical protein